MEPQKDHWNHGSSLECSFTGCAFTNNFRQLFTARLFIGVGESGYAPGGTAMIAGMYPERKRSLLMGIWNAAIPLGSALGVALGGIIATHWGWRHALVLWPFRDLLWPFCSFLYAITKPFRWLKMATILKKRKIRMGLKDIVAEFVERPSLLFTYLGITGVVFVTNSILFWLATYFNRMYGLPMDKAGPRASLVMLLALIGAPIGGFITDRWKRTRPNARLLFPAISTFLSAIFFCFWHLLCFQDQCSTLCSC
jgi:MFS family permease